LTFSKVNEIIIN